MRIGWTSCGDVQAVWRAFTEAAHLGQVVRARSADSGARGRLVPRKCGPRHRDGSAHRRFRSRRRLRLIYLPSPTLPAADSAIVADFIMEGSPEGTTIVRVLGSGVPDGPDWDTPYKRMRLGWERAMARLKVYVEKQMKEEPTGQ